MVALAAGKEAFSDYSHVYSPHKFTQPQLFACLVLKEFEKKDYRGVCALLADWQPSTSTWLARRISKPSERPFHQRATETSVARARRPRRRGVPRRQRRPHEPSICSSTLWLPV